MDEFKTINKRIKFKNINQYAVYYGFNEIKKLLAECQ